MDFEDGALGVRARHIKQLSTFQVAVFHTADGLRTASTNFHEMTIFKDINTSWFYVVELVASCNIPWYVQSKNG